MQEVTITGFHLREAIRAWELQRNTVFRQLEESLVAFPGEDKPVPQDLTTKFLEAEEAIAHLQEAQARYNLAVRVDFNGGQISLCKAIKMIGGLGRVSAFWRNAAGGRKKDRWESSRDLVRRSDEIRAEPTVTVEASTKLAFAFDAKAGSLRAAISVGNNTRRPIQEIGLDPSYLKV